MWHSVYYCELNIITHMKIEIDLPESVSKEQSELLKSALQLIFEAPLKRSLSGTTLSGSTYFIDDKYIVINDRISLTHSDFESIILAYKSFK